MGRQALSAAEKQARLLKIFSGENKAKQHFFNKAELEKIGDKEQGITPQSVMEQVDMLVEAIGAVHAVQRRRMTIAWVLLGGVNHDAAEVEGLRRLTRDVPIRLNLIDVNGQLGFRRATEDERNAFIDQLKSLKVPFVRRYSVGSESNSACGMLAACSPRA